MISRFARHCFTTANSFKSRSKLTEFYKATHPDLLGNAPDHVKLENARSLQQLNSYLDALSQNSIASGMDLTFFIPNKANKKARTFFPIQVKLNPYKSADEQYQKETIEQQLYLQKYVRVTKQLVVSVVQAQEEIDTAHLKKKPGYIDLKGDWMKNVSKVRQDILEEEIIPKRDRRQAQDLLQQSIFVEIKKQEAQDLRHKVEMQMSRANAPHTKPRDWANMIIHQSGYFTNLIELFNKLLDPRLIYIHNDLSEKEIEIFKQRIIPKDENLQGLAILRPVFESMEQSEPQINLLVTRAYGCTDIPGYFSIPYNFEAEEMIDQFETLSGEILQSIRAYNQQLQMLENLKAQIAQKHPIVLQIDAVLNSVDKLMSMRIALLKLQKCLGDISQIRRQIVITDKLEVPGSQNGILFLTPSFTKEQFGCLCMT